MAQKSASSSGPILLIAVGIFLVLAFLLWQVLTNTPQLPSASTRTPSYGVQRVSISEAKAAFDRKEATFVDVRGLYYFQTSHIAGSVNIPLDEIEARYKELDPQQWIITYCT